MDAADADGAAVLNAADEVQHPGRSRVPELREAEPVAFEYDLESGYLKSIFRYFSLHTTTPIYTS